MVPCAIVSEQTESATSASQSGDEGDELTPGNELADELADRAVYTEKLHGNSAYPVELQAPHAEKVGMELLAFPEGSEDDSFGVPGTGRDCKVVPSANGSKDGLPVAQESGGSWAPSPWVTIARGTFTVAGDLTAEEVQNPGEPVFQLDPEIDLCGDGPWPKGLNYSPSQQLETGSRHKKKRRLTKSARDARRKRVKHRAYRLAEGENESGCEADSESPMSEDEKDDDEDDEKGKELMASLGLWYLALASTY